MKGRLRELAWRDYLAVIQPPTQLAKSKLRSIVMSNETRCEFEAC